MAPNLPFESSLAPILDTVLDAVVVIDKTGIIVGWNEVAETTFGWTRDEAVGCLLGKLIVPDQYRTAHNDGLRRYLATGEARVLGQRIEIGALTKAGEDISVELAITTTCESDGGQIFIGFLRDISERIRAEEQRQLLVYELDHRVKNILAVVQSIAHQSFKSADDLGTVREIFSSRLQALAGAHELLIGADWKAAKLDRIIVGAIEGCGVAPDRFMLNGPDYRLGAGAAVTVAMAVHELCTNAIKYGALSNDTGSIAIEWEIDKRDDRSEFAFEWCETGGPPIETPPTREGFGTRLLQRGLAHELGGTLTIDYPPDGLVFRFRAALGRGGERRGRDTP